MSRIATLGFGLLIFVENLASQGNPQPPSGQAAVGTHISSTKVETR
jgi:hypothetical protein